MKKIFVRSIFIILVGSLVYATRTLYVRYAISDTMVVSVTEYSDFEYPEDPADRSIFFGHYADRKLTLVKKDETHFDFVLEPTDPRTAKIVFKNIDVSLMTPSEPSWTKSDPHLERIALTDRQWNRQQVSFSPKSSHIEVSGGDGFEQKNLYSVELAKNCLNAGLWEVLLFTQEDGHKALYYQNWFRFPLGHYKNVFEHNTGVSYLKHWYKLEHWSNPQGEPIEMEKLRRVVSENRVQVRFNPEETRIFAGEQVRKQRTTNAINLRTWGDIVSGAPIQFAAFLPPGRYFVGHPWKNEYWRLAHFKEAIVRKVISKAKDKPLSELELVFEDKDGKSARMIVSGVDFFGLPQLQVAEYPKGLYMPMGIGVPPFFQSYEELEKNPPDQSPYFSVLLDAQGRWINHHEVAIDGPIMHRDEKDPNVLHVYLLSYERHTLIGHYVVPIPGDASVHEITSATHGKYGNFSCKK